MPKKKYDGSVILDLPMRKNDAKAKTIRDYLKKLLSTLIEEEEGFSGKRPFGNSGWIYDFEYPLVKAGIIRGNINDRGDCDAVAPSERDDAMAAAIAALK